MLESLANLVGGSSVKAWIWVLCVVSTANLLASAQDMPGRRPVLTGSIISVTPRINPDGPKPLFVYQVRLNLLLRNDTGETLILFRPSLDLVSRRLEFVDGYGETLKPSPWFVPLDIKLEELRKRNLSRSVPANSRENQFQTFAKGLDTQSPTQANLLKLEPGGFFEFSEVLTIEDAYKLEVLPGQSLADVSTNSTIAVFPGLRIEYKLSLKSHHPNDGLLRTLRSRWSRFGRLVINDAGDFSLRSEVMFNRDGT